MKISSDLVKNITLKVCKIKIDWNLPSSWCLFKFIMQMIKNSKLNSFIKKEKKKKNL